MLRKRLIPAICVAAVARVLTGCGGSGDNGVPVEAPPADPSLVDLKRDNSQRIVFAVRGDIREPPRREINPNPLIDLFTIAPDGTDRLRLTQEQFEPWIEPDTEPQQSRQGSRQGFYFGSTFR